MDSRAWLLVTLVLYAVGALHALLFAVLRRSVLTTVSLTATLLGFAFHTASLALRWSEGRPLPGAGAARRRVLPGLGDRHRVPARLRDDARRRGRALRVPVRVRARLRREPDPRVRAARPGAPEPVPAGAPRARGVRLRRPLRRVHDGRHVPVPGEGAALAHAAQLLLPDPEPRAVGHDRRAQRARRLRLPDARDPHRLLLEPQPARPLLDGRPEGVGGARGVGDLRGHPRRALARGMGRPPRRLARDRRASPSSCSRSPGRRSSPAWPWRPGDRRRRAQPRDGARRGAGGARVPEGAPRRGARRACARQRGSARR